MRYLTPKRVLLILLLLLLPPPLVLALPFLVSAAVDLGAAPVAEVLIRCGVPVEWPQRIEPGVVIRAVVDGDRPLLDFALAHHAEVNRALRNGTTALHIAAARGDRDIIDRLIQAGAQVNRTNIHDATPLSVAVQLNDPKTVEFLLARGAMLGPTDLLLAVRFTHVQLVEFILAKGVSPNAPTPSRESPFTEACARASEPIVRAFLEHGVDVNRRWPDGSVGLVRAAHYCELATVEQLLAAGADPSVRERNGDDAIDAALRAKCASAVAILRTAAHRTSHVAP